MPHAKEEQTLVIIKPDGVQRTLIGEVIKRYERIGLKLVAMKMLVPTADHIEAHYTLDPDWMKVTGEKRIKSALDKGEKPPHTDPLEITKVVLANLKKYMTSGPVVAMVWQGAHAVKIVRKITGGTEPLTSDVGTIRGDYVLDSYVLAETDGRSVRNVIHASGSVEEARNEIKHWFLPGEITAYRLIADEILYDVNLDGIVE